MVHGSTEPGGPPPGMGRIGGEDFRNATKCDIYPPCSTHSNFTKNNVTQCYEMLRKHPPSPPPFIIIPSHIDSSRAHEGAPE